MKKNIMLLHMGDRPDLYLNITISLESMGAFVYDNREAVFNDRLDRVGIDAFVYLVSNDTMLDKLVKEINELSNGCIILVESMREKRESLWALVKERNIKILCDDSCTRQMHFVLGYLADNQEEYKSLKEIYGVIRKYNLVEAYYCIKYMRLEMREWRNIKRAIINGIDMFRKITAKYGSVHSLFCDATAMIMINNINRKLYDMYEKNKFIRRDERATARFKPDMIMEVLNEIYNADHTMNMTLILMAGIEQNDMRMVIKLFNYVSDYSMGYYAHYKFGVFLQKYKGNSEKEFRASLNKNPYYRSSLYNLGLILERQHKFDEAIRCYNKILLLLGGQVDSNSMHPIEYEYAVKSSFRLGYCYKRLGRLQVSKEYFNRALSIYKSINDNKFIGEFFCKYLKEPVNDIKRKVAKAPILAGLEEIKRIERGEWK